MVASGLLPLTPTLLWQNILMMAKKLKGLCTIQAHLAQKPMKANLHGMKMKPLPIGTVK